MITTSVTSSNLVTLYDLRSGEERKEIIQQSSLFLFFDCRRGQSNAYLNLPFGVCISLLFTKLLCIHNVEITYSYFGPFMQMFLSALIDAAGHAGKLDAAFEILQKARVQGIQIGIVSYSSLMGACSNVCLF